MLGVSRTRRESIMDDDGEKNADDERDEKFFVNAFHHRVTPLRLFCA